MITRSVFLSLIAFGLLLTGDAHYVAAQTGQEAKTEQSASVQRVKKKSPSNKKRSRNSGKPNKRAKTRRPEKTAVPTASPTSVPTEPQLKDGRKEDGSPGTTPIVELIGTPVAEPIGTPVSAARCQEKKNQCLNTMREKIPPAKILDAAYDLERAQSSVIDSIPVECGAFLPLPPPNQAVVQQTLESVSVEASEPVEAEESPEELQARCEREIQRAREEFQKLEEKSGKYRDLVRMTFEWFREDGTTPPGQEGENLFNRIDQECEKFGITFDDWAAYHGALRGCVSQFLQCMKGTKDQVEL